MFTGLVEETGKIINIAKKTESFEITVRGKKVVEKAQVGDSIAVNGVCLTITKLNGNDFTADVMFETIERSGLKHAKAGDTVNLEKSLTLTTFLGGHLVMGDVDCEARILSITDKGIAKVYEFQLDEKHKNNMKYIVEKGRITIDGASLTVINVNDNAGIFSVSLIPHTIDNITVGMKKTGDYVNIETDLFGKYVEKILKFNDFNNIEKKEKKSNLTMEFLQKNGF